MASRGFCVKIQLDLHAITCPGVWLCPNGDVALRMNSLGCTLESDRVSPIFPLLFHNEFNFKKTFTRLAALTELQRCLEAELFYTELIQWLSPCNRKPVVLATFESTLADVLYPVSQYKGLLAGVDVDLLMDPTKYFPGIIAPKIEISTKTVVEEVLSFCHTGSGEGYVLNPKTVNSKRVSSVHRKRPVKGIIRQKRVCHSRAKPRTRNSQNSEPARYPPGSSNIENICQSRQICVKDNCYSVNDKSQYLDDINIKEKNQCVPPIRDCLQSLDQCPVCLRYGYYFSDNRGELPIQMGVLNKYKQSVKGDQNLKRVDHLYGAHCCCTCKPKISTALTRATSALQSEKQYARETTGRALHCMEHVYTGRDISERAAFHKHDQSDTKQCFYKNLERFYERMYKHAKLRALEANCC